MRQIRSYILSARPVKQKQWRRSPHWCPATTNLEVDLQNNLPEAAAFSLPLRCFRLRSLELEASGELNVAALIGGGWASGGRTLDGGDDRLLRDVGRADNGIEVVMVQDVIELAT